MSFITVKTYINRLPTIVPKTIEPTLAKPRSTTKARNMTADTLAVRQKNRSRRRFFSEVDEASSNVENVDPEDEGENVDLFNITLLNKLRMENKNLETQDECQKT